MKSAEQVATVVHISAAGTMPIEVKDSPTEEYVHSSLFNYCAKKLDLMGPLYLIFLYQIQTPRKLVQYR